MSLLSPVLCLVLLTPAFPETAPRNAELILGKWVSNTFYFKELQFTSDGKFIQTVEANGTRVAIHGTYKIARGDILELTWGVVKDHQTTFSHRDFKVSRDGLSFTDKGKKVEFRRSSK